MKVLVCTAFLSSGGDKTGKQGLCKENTAVSGDGMGDFVLNVISSKIAHGKMEEYEDI